MVLRFFAELLSRTIGQAEHAAKGRRVVEINKKKARIDFKTRKRAIKDKDTLKRKGLRTGKIFKRNGRWSFYISL